MTLAKPHHKLTMPAIHQFSAGFAKGDAISNEVRVLRELFRSWGFASDVFTEQRRISPELRKDARDIAEAAATFSPDDIALLHLSIGSPVNAAFAALTCKKAILYHNVTPPDYFRGVQEEIAHHLRAGLEQVRALAGVADVNLAVSRFNAQELALLGYRNVHVMPMKLDRQQWEGPLDRRILQEFGDGRINILFVGRGAPNKRIEDLLFSLYYTQRHVDPDARLIHVGSYGGLERYQALLRTKACELKVRNLSLVGSVPAEALRSYYAVATVFLCLSEHEGFCIPLIEAMAREVPVMAFAAAAIPETLDGTGILLREKRFDIIAELIGRLARDNALRKAITDAQTQRLHRYLTQDFASMWRAHLQPLLPQ
ncbi:MAG: glycosyltransferase family 4 protein [Verrucomicrobia bacterium]|nr:glycosyltransferase family 4 protein [Kiritimatiellia bacterium]MCO6401453.1 glycosyltransferase family 4 protein [Verrucomicrobiota bacterium]